MNKQRRGPSIPHTFFKYCEQNIGGCGKRFQPNGKGQRTCEPCKKKKKAMRYKK